jgi:hypothetical protein
MTPGRLFTLEEIIGMLREAKVALSAEAVEKGTRPPLFIPIFIFSDPPKKYI